MESSLGYEIATMGLTMSIEEKELKRIISEVMSEKTQKCVLNDESYQTHYDYVRLQIEKDRRRQELWQKFRLSFIGSLGVSLVGAMIWVGKIVLESISIGGSPHS